MIIYQELKIVRELLRCKPHSVYNFLDVGFGSGAKTMLNSEKYFDFEFTFTGIERNRQDVIDYFCYGVSTNEKYLINHIHKYYKDWCDGTSKFEDFKDCYNFIFEDYKNCINQMQPEYYAAIFLRNVLHFENSIASAKVSFDNICNLLEIGGLLYFEVVNCPQEDGKERIIFKSEEFEYFKHSMNQVYFEENDNNTIMVLEK